MALKKTVKAKSNQPPKQTTVKAPAKVEKKKSSAAKAGSTKKVSVAPKSAGSSKPKMTTAPASTRPAVSKSVVEKPQVSSKPASVKAVESKSAEAKSVESKTTVETKVESKVVDAKLLDVKSAAVSKATEPINGTNAAALKKSIAETNRPPKSAFDEELTDLGPFTVAELRKVKTGLARKDLDEYKQLLLEKRAELLGDVASLETDARNHADGNSSNMPDHMADVGSDNYEQEFTLGLVESERKLLAEINASLRRIRENIYGICLETGVPISRARLDIKPWAKYCIEVERNHERRHRR